jgi:cyanophycinase
MDAFLIGGGRDEAGVRASHAPFVRACDGGPIVCLALDEGDGVDAERWRAALAGAGAGEVRVVAIALGRPPGDADLAGAAGVYVAGGLTPLYAEVLRGFSPPPGVPYAGFSAGAAVAGARAVVGGWRDAVSGAAVCPEEAGEDLDPVTVVTGLGVVPFAVDVHAAQWGTLGRLVHAVESGLVDEGYALDEHTVLLPDRTVAGAGAAWHVTRAAPVRRVTALG